jgi:hypothetical protein
MRLALEVEPQIAPDHRLDRWPSDRGLRLRRRLGTQPGKQLFQEDQLPAERQHVALDPEMAHADHTDEALVADRRNGFGEFGPGLGRGDQGEDRRCSGSERDQRVTHTVAHRKRERYDDSATLQARRQALWQFPEVDHIGLGRSEDGRA